MEMQMLLQNKPYLSYSDRIRIQPFGALISLLTKGSHKASAFNVFDVNCPVGFSMPLHIHYAEDIAVFVVEGKLTIVCGNEKEEARVYSYLFHPRGTPHGFRVQGKAPVHILYMTIPAGFDEFVLEQATTFYIDCMRDAAPYKIEILGPLPE